MYDLLSMWCFFVVVDVQFQPTTTATTIQTATCNCSKMNRAFYSSIFMEQLHGTVLKLTLHSAVVTSLFVSFPCFIHFFSFTYSFLCFAFFSSKFFALEQHARTHSRKWTKMHAYAYGARSMGLSIFQVICNEFPIETVRIDPFKLI